MREIREILALPPEECRGMTRWWWYGGRVSREEIRRELDEMQRAGIGGVEIQILYPLDPDAEDGKNLAFGSPEYYDMLRFAGEECRRRGMVMDVTPGSSWPFGGPVITHEEAQVQMLPYQIDIQGPVSFSCDLTTRIAGDVSAAVLGRMDGARMDPKSVRDVSGCFEVRELFGWPWGTKVEKLDVPEGTWKLFFLVKSMHLNQVGKPGRNAGGPVLDHGSRKALDVFFRHMVSPVLEKAGVHALFCDSIEVEGHNWTHALFGEFRGRRGYDLHPWIYALWGDMGDVTERVRYDFFRTMSELTLENFFGHFTSLAHEKGVKTRIQAHGTWGEILRAYAAADIPEGETFGEFRGLEVNTIHRRLAASSGHIYGKNIISCESFTWLKRPRFTETPEELKAAADAEFLDGINMIVNHGYAYDSGEPRPFYAGSNINHRNPWWPDYRHLADYVQRMCAVLRLGRPVSEVAVFLPEADIYAESMLSELHLAMALEDRLGREFMTEIQKWGYWFDYVNDEALTGAHMEEGGMRLQGNLYRVLILIGVKRLEPETAAAMKRFQDMGGQILCVQTRPDRSCGLPDRERRDRMVREYAESFPEPVPGDALRKRLEKALAPEVAMTHPDAVGFVHRRLEDRDLWFFANQSGEVLEESICFRDMKDMCGLYSPQKLDGTYAHAGHWDSSCRRLSLKLEAYESVLAVFGETGEAYEEEVFEPICRLEGWKLELDGRILQMDEASPWSEYAETEGISGEGVYSTGFECAEGRYRLTVAGAGCTAEVELDGKSVGSIWMHPYRLVLGELKAGRHELRIHVRSTLYAKMRQMETEPVPDVLDTWPYYGRIINEWRSTRLSMKAERESGVRILSGLCGPVILEKQAEKNRPEAAGD